MLFEIPGIGVDLSYAPVRTPGDQGRISSVGRWQFGEGGPEGV